MKVSVNRFKKVATTFLKDESGQSTTEYVLLLVFVVMAVKAVGSKLQGGLSQLIDTAMGRATSEINKGE